MLKKIIASMLSCILLMLPVVWLAGNGNFWVALENAADTASLQISDVDVLNQIEDQFTGQWIGWWESVRDFLARAAMEVAIPLLVFAGVAMAIVGFYKLMVSESPEETTTANKYILRWIIGIVIMLSAAYLANQLVWVSTNPWQEWVVEIITTNWLWWEVAQYLYDSLFYPFLQIVIYIIIWILFIFALINAFKYIFNNEPDTKKKWILSVVYAVIWTVTIILAKSLVELFYGEYSQVVNNPWQNVWWVWEGILNNPDYELIYTIINWALGLVAFIIVILIIVQWYQILTTPDDQESLKKVQTNFWYIFLWIVVLWIAYLIVNVFIIQG